MTALTLLGLAVRTASTIAYWPALWFYTDSSRYIWDIHHLHPAVYAVNSFAYSVFLRLFSYTGSLGFVVIFQHLLGVGLAIAIYLLLRRRGVTGWLAALGAAPVLLDAHLVVLEQYILTDSVFTVLVTGTTIMLLWRDRYPVAVYAVLGGLAVATVLTRSAGVVVPAIVLLYLMVKRVGWLRVATFTVAVAVPMLGYLTWAHSITGRFSLTTMQGRYLYSRTAAIADCDRLELSDRQRLLCPAQPRSQRPQRGDWYVWNDPNVAHFSQGQDPLLGSFARAVIMQQPRDYAVLVLRDTARYLVPGIPVDASSRCLFGWWEFPADVRDSAPDDRRCKAMLASDHFQAQSATPTGNQHAGLRATLAWYSDWITTPRIALGGCVILTLAALVWRPRRPRWRDALDAALPVGLGLGLIVTSVATSMYEVRYGIGSTGLITMGGVLAVQRLIAASGPPGAAPATPTDTATPTAPGEQP